MESIPMTILTGGASQAAGTLVGPATEAGTGIYKSLKRKYDYIQQLPQNFENLEKEARYLTSREKDVTDLIAKNQIVAEKTHECTTWLEEVERVTAELNNVRIRYQNTASSSGFSDLRTRLKLSKQTVKMRKSVVELRERFNLEWTLTEKCQERSEKFPQYTSKVHSLRENVENLINLLDDDNVKKIGIWGMPGVGKTTILENLNEEVAKVQMFDIVLWVNAGKENNINHIQQTILKQLTSKVDVINTRFEIVSFISETLKNKKYLLLLDDVSSKIELRHVGIHDGHMNGKVVVATRERKICYEMEMDDDVKIERMSREDARKLFHDVVGKVVDHPNFAPIAERIVIQCGEQPQIIRAIGNYLKGKLDEDLWQTTLTKLQSPNMYELKHLEDLSTAFKLIYEDLKGSLKECLLYGALFPEDHEIYREYLVECWRTEQLIGIGQTFRIACEEGHTNLEDLIDKCLFDQCQSIKHVKMPIIFRHAAIRMAKLQNFGLLVMDHEELEKCRLSSVDCRNIRVISLINSNLTELPERLGCPKISTLFLQKNEELTTIPVSLFEQMCTLKTLDLYDVGIKELPPSVSKLTNLRGLYLNGCRYLERLPNEVRELQNLEVLDISRSGIRGFPQVIGELTSLQCLRVSFDTDLDSPHSSPKIFESLNRLEDVSIVVDPTNAHWNMIVTMICAKLAKLKKLSALTFYFPCTESLNAFISTSISWKNGTSQTRSNFRSFNIYVGSLPHNKSSQLDVSKCSSRRYLQYSGGKYTPEAIKEVLKKTCAFQLVNHQDVIKFSDFGIDGMNSLEICMIESCNAMKVIFEINFGEISVLPWLKELHLIKLPELTHISKGPIAADSFSQLTKLILRECQNISPVISWELAKELKELQELRIQECSQVTHVFEVDGRPMGAPLCPKLKILELLNLERLVSIHDSYMFEWIGLQKIEIIGCEKMKNLCLNEMNARKLRHIRCSKVWWETLTLSDKIRAHLLRFCCFEEAI